MYTYSVSEGARTSCVLSLDNHVDIVAALKEFCKEKGIRSGEIRGLGAVCRATLRFLNPEIRNYVDRTFEEQMEIANLTGNVSVKDGDVYLHVHAVFGRSDYTCVGGHLLEATVNGACELFVEDYGLDGIGRRFDSETGLNLYDLRG